MSLIFFAGGNVQVLRQDVIITDRKKNSQNWSIKIICIFLQWIPLKCLQGTNKNVKKISFKLHVSHLFFETKLIFWQNNICLIQLETECRDRDFVSRGLRQTEQSVQMDFRPLWGSGWTAGESVFSYSQHPLISFLIYWCFNHRTPKSQVWVHQIWNSQNSNPKKSYNILCKCRNGCSLHNSVFDISHHISLS